MMIHLVNSLNWLAVFAAFTAYFFLGPLWYVFLFKKQYAISLGREKDAEEKPSALYIAGPALCSLVITITSSVFIYALDIRSYSSAWEFAALAGTGYLVANTFNIAINPNIPRPMLYGLISGAFHLVGIFMVCTIVYALK